VACSWRCPYCQLPEQRQGAPAAVADILAALQRAIRAHPSVDVVTLAGNGEPLDHPRFTSVAKAVLAAARRLRARAVLLSNGDHLARWRELVGCFDLAYLKWDPGPRGGAWRSLTGPALRERRIAFARQPHLRIQAMLSGEVDRDEERLDRWLADLRGLRPIEVHLTTIERPPADPRMRAAPAARLERWRAAAAAALGVPVLSFPGSPMEVPS
jgi:pyruvate-formate lyase-activating enzyme